MTLKEFLPYLKKKRPVEEVKNLVTNCNCPRPDWINGVMWTITPGNEYKSLFPHGKEDNGFLHHGEEATCSVFQGKADKDGELPVTMDNISEPKNLTDGQNVTLEVKLTQKSAEPHLIHKDLSRTPSSVTGYSKDSGRSSVISYLSESVSSVKPENIPPNITGSTQQLSAMAKLSQSLSEEDFAEKMTETGQNLNMPYSTPFDPAWMDNINQTVSREVRRTNCMKRSKSEGALAKNEKDEENLSKQNYERSKSIEKIKC